MKKRLKDVSDLVMGMVMAANVGFCLGSIQGTTKLGRNLFLGTAAVSAGIGAWWIRDFVKKNTKDDSYIIYKGKKVEVP